MNRLEAVTVTNEILSNLTTENCVSILREVKYNILKLNEVLMLKYPEIAGFYYDNNCTQFCREVIIKHIIKYGIEMVSAVIF